MKIVEINTVNVGSTGKIMLQIANEARKSGHEVYTFSRAWRGMEGTRDNHTFFGSYFENLAHRVMGPLTGNECCFSKRGTKELVKKLKKIDPDVIHLHNLHGWYINLPILFKYIKEYNKRVVWTLHDCWSFTGHCPHFVTVDCEKWKTGCFDCPLYGAYPKSRFDNSKKMYEKKKAWFTGVRDLTVVTPSMWLGNLVKQSFMKEYDVKVINNGIDTYVFKPTEGDFKNKYNLDGKRVVLGVAFGWGVRKGLDCFVELSKRLPQDYKIVLVGTDENVDKQLPSNIISIHRTNNQRELAEIYSLSDVLVNPTREDTYPTVNMEAIACGTPVITFDVGGSPEMLDNTCGVVVAKNDIDSLEKEIIKACEEKMFSREACLQRAKEFDKEKKFKEYIRLYEQ